MKAISYTNLLFSIVVIDVFCFVLGTSSADIIVEMAEKSFELHFIYLVETRIDRFSNHHLRMIENLILHKIEQIRDWNEEGASIITEIDTSPSDTINTNGFCVPLQNNTSCFVIDGRMSMRASGDNDDATAKFYRVLKEAMAMDTSKDDNPSIDENLYFYRAVEENNIISSSDKERVAQRTIIMLLVLLSVGVFSLTLIVLYLLCNRAGRESHGMVPTTESRLGISAVNYLGNNWLEVKSTSSGSYSSEASSNLSSATRLPQIVGNSSHSVCCSSVSELSAQTLETCRKAVKHSADLEKIEEESPCIESLSRQGIDPVSSLNEFQSVCNDKCRGIEVVADDSKEMHGEEIEHYDEETPSTPDNTGARKSDRAVYGCPSKHIHVEETNNFDEEISMPSQSTLNNTGASFYTSVESPPMSSSKKCISNSV